jgi:hypothetical protein
MTNNNQTELNIEELYTRTTTAEQIKESFDRMTMPTGRYIYAATKVEALRGNDEHPFPALRSREFAHIFGKVTTVEGKKRGSVGFDASWDLRRTETGKLDKVAKLWGQIVVALDMKEKPIPEVLDALRQYPLSVYINESFKTPEGYRTARDEQARAEYRKAGYESRNFIESVSKL